MINIKDESDVVIIRVKELKLLNDTPSLVIDFKTPEVRGTDKEALYRREKFLGRSVPRAGLIELRNAIDEFLKKGGK